MLELRTQQNNVDVDAYLSRLTNAGRREDAFRLVDIMQRVTKCPPRMWGSSIIGFDRYEYTPKSGKTASMMMTGFAPRKANMVVYIMPGFSQFEALLQKLGPHKHSVSCLYLGRLTKVDLQVLETLVARSVEDMRNTYP